VSELDPALAGDHAAGHGPGDVEHRGQKSRLDGQIDDVPGTGVPAVTGGPGDQQQQQRHHGATEHVRDDTSVMESRKPWCAPWGVDLCPGAYRVGA
jgi:hypothetical protein